MVASVPDKGSILSKKLVLRFILTVPESQLPAHIFSKNASPCLPSPPLTPPPSSHTNRAPPQKDLQNRPVGTALSGRAPQDRSRPDDDANDYYGSDGRVVAYRGGRSVCRRVVSLGLRRLPVRHPGGHADEGRLPGSVTGVFFCPGGAGGERSGAELGRGLVAEAHGGRRCWVKRYGREMWAAGAGKVCDCGWMGRWTRGGAAAFEETGSSFNGCAQANGVVGVSTDGWMSAGLFSSSSEESERRWLWRTQTKRRGRESVCIVVLRICGWFSSFSLLFAWECLGGRCRPIDTREAGVDICFCSIVSLYAPRRPQACGGED